MLNRDFKEFAELLNARGVEQLVVGGYALAALQDFGFGSLGLGLGDFSADTVVQLGRPPRRIDLLTTIDGVEFDACFARREQVQLSGVPLHIIGLEDFKANKLASGRLEDLADLESLGLSRAVDPEGTPG
mgnify:FL=1|jgi:hypothetical protein